ncbi:hypothetical protein PR202_ga09430 [Eleusine coracana subsp. coracana]|uniref:Receptor-like serine/threonine-protein kinase n=1 Tax=Eleusine coracana subsp. coracana TaxID=191504 RepID=A0AAV5C4Y1_ELECO|nr:hypothetical protein PR202_ga09430 [Eleusine coracana subsp. coracana]
MGVRALSLLLLAATATCFTRVTSTDTIFRNTTITGNQTLISSKGLYALGFFSPSGADDGRTYLGIWYANIPGPMTVVWVANRQDPVLNSPAVLQLSAGGRLVILDGKNDTVWSSPAPTRTVITGRATARLLDSGNFILSSDGSGSDDQSVAWQSFDYPTDTLLPGMKLGVDSRAGITRNITSWRSPSDPSPGDYTFKLVSGGLPQFFLVQQGGTKRIYTSGPWNGDILTGVPYLKSKDLTFKVVYSPDETYYSYAIRDPSLFSRLLVVNSNDGLGQLRRFSLNNGAWNNFWYYPTDQCDFYAKCGPFGYCDPDRSPPCSCLPGFVPRSLDQWSKKDWSAGCVRNTNLSCDGGDGFWVESRMKLPQATDAAVYMGMNLDQCRQACLSNCSCGAYAAANMSGGVGVGCVIWTVDLLDMRQYPIVVQDVYIRLAQSEIDALNAAAADNGPPTHKSKLIIIIIVASVAGALFLLTAVACCCFWMNKGRRKGQIDTASSLPPSTVDHGLPYRVRSHPAPSPVRNEHLGDLYENRRYTGKDVDLPLFDLDVILDATDNFAEHNKIGSDEGKRRFLKWKKRYEIILGIARDFGIARMFGGDQTTAYTAKVIGTYGYMSPEYAMDGIISMKSDVFSFGVLVMEIVSGKRNRGSYEPELDVNLLGYPRNRPLMSAVVTMLTSENVVLAEPNEPGLSVGIISSDTGSSQTQSATTNTITSVHDL